MTVGELQELLREFPAKDAEVVIHIDDESQLRRIDDLVPRLGPPPKPGYLLITLEPEYKEG